MSFIKFQGWGAVRKYLLRGLGFTLLGGCIAWFFPIAVITSPSIDTQIALITPFKPQKGDLVFFKHEKHEMPMVKRLLATEGDLVPQLPLVDHLKPNLAIIVPPGYAFVAGTHELSYDSRYEDYGFIKLSELNNKVFSIY
jgi:hypothetical protein